jgi:hypothetical protein
MWEMNYEGLCPRVLDHKGAKTGFAELARNEHFLALPSVAPLWTAQSRHPDATFWLSTTLVAPLTKKGSTSPIF